MAPVRAILSIFRAVAAGKLTAAHRTLWFALTFALGLSVSSPSAAQSPGDSAARSSQASRRSEEKLHAEFCASCHGARWQGGLAPSLLDPVWAHGKDLASVERSIRDGWPQTGMPPFKEVLSPAEISALAAHILRSHEAALAEPPRPMPAPAAPADSVRASELHRFAVETVADGLITPWGLAFLPDGRLLVSERPGRLRVVAPGRGIVETISGIPAVWSRQDGGLLDVAVHPDYARNGWLYLAFSEPGAQRGTSTTRVLRGRIHDGALVDQQLLFDAPAESYWHSNTHYGARFLFDRAGYLYVSIGERGRPTLAQNLASPFGKIHRVHDDGRAPPDNPFQADPAAVKTLWSYGHRNPQGLAQHPLTGELWATEHGPHGGDELNVILPGRNYGWPLVTHGRFENGRRPESATKEGVEAPVAHWTPTIAPGAAEFYTGDRFPRWKNHLFIAVLAGEHLRRVELDGRRVTHQEVVLEGLGRVRDVVTAPDGHLYVALNSHFGNSAGKVVRLVPAD